MTNDFDIPFDQPTPDEMQGGRRRRRRTNRDATIIDEHTEQSDTKPQESEPTNSHQRKTSSRPVNKPERKSLVERLQDKRLKLLLGGLLLIFSVVVLIATFSYVRHGATDQSEAMNSTISEMAQTPGAVENSAGAMGASLTHFLFVDTFGIASLLMVAYCVVLGLKLVRQRRTYFWSLTFKALLVTVAASIVIGLVTYNAETEINWGGNHGRYVNKYLLDTCGWIVTSIVSLALIFTVVCVYLNDIIKLYQKWRNNRRMRREYSIEEQHRREMAKNLETPEQTTPDSKSTSSTDKAESHSNPSPANITFEPTPDLSGIVDISEIDTKPATKAEKPAKKAADEIDGFSIDGDDTDNSTDAGFTITSNQIEKADVIHTSSTAESEYDHRAELSRFRMPSIDLLEDRPSGPSVDKAEQNENKERIIKTLLNYDIPVERIEATVGPTVTLFEIVPAEGVRIARIKSLEDDIAMSLSALGIRIIAPIPGKGTVGIEVPNRDAQTVSMRSIVSSRKFQECKMALPMAMGATISNEIFIEDLAKMPHLLVAGATGMGKSVGMNAIIASLLYKKHPSELKFVLIDPKMVEFSLYNKLERHYLAKLPDEEDAVITDPAKVIQTLQSLCVEMDNRYALLRQAQVRSIEEYNRKFTQRHLNPDKGHKYLPYIVMIVDEFADLIMTAGKEVEMPIARIAQKARAVGMHMIIATQRPSTNVITGIIKANFPGRIAFRVSQMVDSKTILDRTGANQLIGRGDMLFSHNGKFERVQCAFISTEEVEKITESIDSQIGYEHAYYLPDYIPDVAGNAQAGASIERDPLFDEAARWLVTQSSASTSSLQRRYSIGYNRAGRMMEQFEAAGIVGPASGAKPRSINVDSITLERILNNN